MQTTLKQELQGMQRVVDNRMQGYSLKLNAGGVPGAIFQVLKKHSKVSVAEKEKDNMMAAITAAVTEGQPVLISMLWALGGMATSRYKFLQPEINLPRLGDLWALFVFEAINRKIRQVYTPGMRIVLFDEVPQLRLLGLSEEAIRYREQVMRNVAAKYAPCVQIEELPDFAGLEVDIPVPSDEVVYTLVTAREWGEEIPQEVYSYHYESRDKPWDLIKGMIPASIWRQAVEMQRQMSKIWAARKQVHFPADFFGGRLYIDGCLTEKTRWSPYITGLALPQHGGTVLDRENDGGSYQRFSVKVVPERRLEKAGFQPAMVRTADFGECSFPEKEFAFYWRGV